MKVSKHPPVIERLLDPLLAARYRLLHGEFDTDEQRELAAATLDSIDRLAAALGEPQHRPGAGTTDAQNSGGRP